MERITYYFNGKPRMIIGDTEYSGRISSKLADYEDAEEAGRLVRLPYKVGDIAYAVYAGRVRNVRVYGYFVRGDVISVEVREHHPPCVSGYFVPVQSLYRTREEAKAALKKGKGGKQ